MSLAPSILESRPRQPVQLGIATKCAAQLRKAKAPKQLTVAVRGGAVHFYWRGLFAGRVVDWGTDWAIEDARGYPRAFRRTRTAAIALVIENAKRKAADLQGEVRNEAGTQ